MKTAQKDSNGTIMQFLSGSHSFEGVWFGDFHPKYKGLFWWRRFLPTPSPTVEEKQNSYFEIPKLETSYGDVKEIPDCLVKDIYDAMFYHMKHMHPDQKYRDQDGSDKFRMAVSAARVAIKAMKP